VLLVAEFGACWLAACSVPPAGHGAERAQLPCTQSQTLPSFLQVISILVSGKGPFLEQEGQAWGNGGENGLVC